MSPPNTQHFLIVGPAWIGDMVMAQSLFALLAQQDPAARIDVLAPPWAAPVLARMPEVAQAVAAPFGHGQLKLSGRYQLGRKLRPNRYTRAIVLPNSLKSALVPYWAGIPRRTGYRGEMRWGLLNDVRQLNKQQLPRTIDRFLALGLAPGQDLPPSPRPRLRVSDAAVETALDELGLQHPDQPVLALCPGAEYGPAKRWPPEYFAAVANERGQAGWAVWLFGSQRDAPTAAAIASQLEVPFLNLAGRTDLRQAIDLLSLADAVVTNDSGLMHVATALDRRVIALFGSSDPRHTPPLSPRATPLWLQLECSPCFQRECPLGHLNCLNNLKPDRVIALLQAETEA